ncbi:MAG: hypothetical protein JSS83_22110 [Cyanobacteria bacterium SZAS LIN-3]|nr:hypothetical protein [Cyanobacteria bacterium SZAS LIN-3]MBS2005730.1 hypothetical protein [Cyanobacteria bacterium SZAS TMP-1]
MPNHPGTFGPMVLHQNTVHAFNHSAFNQGLSNHTTAGATTVVHTSSTNAHNVFHSGLVNTLNLHAVHNLNHVNVFTLQTATNLALQSVSLDLSSSSANVTLGASLFKAVDSVSITVGGTTQTFHPGSQVTAAEYVAIRQVLGGGTQTLVVNNTGVASGGAFSLNAVASSKVSELVVPAGVVAIDNIANTKSLTFGGDILNYGSIYGVSNNSHSLVGTIFAKDIINEAGGIISTQSQASVDAAYHGSLSNVSLILSAVNNISNAGLISSGGSLTLSAGGTITNAAATVGGASPIMQAVHNVNLSTASGNLTNAGLIAASTGNINVLLAGGSTASAININGSGGTFQAFRGNINVGTEDSGASTNINLSGGDYLSQNLNLNAGSGSITGSVGQVTGNLNEVGEAAHFLADTATLHLGSNCIKGDPTYVNVGGDVVIDGALTASEDLTVIAAGNITASGNAFISTANSVGGAAVPNTDVTLIAGAGVTTTGTGTGGDNSGSTNTSGMTVLNGTQAAVVDFTTGKGGNIDLSGSTHVGPIIDTSSNLATGGFNQINGGNVTLAAFASGTTGGQIIFPATIGSSITAASATGNGGSVSIFAGANPAANTTTIKAGDIVTTGGAISGNVAVYTAQPTTTDTKTISYGIDGSVSSANAITFQTAKGVPVLSAKAGVSLGTINAAGANGKSGVGGAADTDGLDGGNGGSAGSITINAGSDISTKNLYAFGGGGGGGGAGGHDNGGGGGNGGNGGDAGNGNTVAVASTNGALTVTGDINISGGGGGGGGGSGTSATRVGGVGGGGGTGGGGITLSAAGAVAVSGGLWAADGSAGGAGGSSTASVAGLAGGGGGGGASYGAGGGGGGGGNASASGGGGGGGAFGGGGGGAAGGLVTDTAGYGGSGGGGLGVGQGGIATGGSVAGNNGVANKGGAGGGATPGTGGTLGNPGAGGGGGDPVNHPEFDGKSGAALVLGIANTADIIATGGSFSTGSDIVGANITLTAKSPVTGFVTLGGNVVGTDTVQMEAAGPGNITQTAGKSISAPTSLQMQTENGDIGSSGQPIVTDASQLTLNSANGSIYISDTGTSATLGTGTGSTYSVTMTNGTAGSIILGAGAAIGGTAKVVLTASGTGTITQTDAAGLITSPLVSLTTAGGDVGQSSQFLNLKAASLTFGLGSGTLYANDSSATINIPTSSSAKNAILTDNLAGGIVFSVASGQTLSATGILSISNNLGNLSFGGTGAATAGSQLSLASGGNLDLGGWLTNGKPFPSTGGASLVAIAGGNIVATGAAGPVILATNSTTGNGGSIDIQAGENFTLQASGVAVGSAPSTNGGSVLFNGGPVVAIDASSTAGVGGSVTISANAGKTAGSGVILDNATILTTGTTGNGDVTLTATGASSTKQSILVGDITAASGKADQSGNIFLIGPTLGTVGNVNAGNLKAGQTNSITTIGNIVYGTGSFSHGLTLTSVNGVITLPATINMDTDGAGAGGTVFIKAPTLTWSSIATTPLIINADATGKGDGGSVTVNVTGTKGVTIGNAKGNIEISARGGSTSGAGGNVSVTSGGNLTVNPIFLTFGPLANGAGGNLSLTAGKAATGNLYVTGPLSAAGTNDVGGTIALQSNSASVFNIDAAKAKTNGVLGGLNVSGSSGNGDISVVNLGGGITLNTIPTAFKNIVLTTGKAGALTINGGLGDATTQSINLKTASGAMVDKLGTLKAVSINLTSTSGAIGTLDVDSTILSANSGGTVSLKSNNSVQLSASSGKKFSVTSAADIITTGALTVSSGLTLTTTNNGKIEIGSDITGGKTSVLTLNANGTGKIEQSTPAGTDRITGGTINLTSTSGTIAAVGPAPLRVNAATLTANTGAAVVNLDNSGTGTLTLKSASTTSTFTLNSVGAIKDSAKLVTASTVAMKSGGAISVGGLLGGASTTAVTLTAGGAGSITATQLITANSVALNATTGVIGSLKVNTASLSASTGGKSVSITDTSTLPVSITSLASGGTLTLNTSASTTLVGNISAAVGLLKVTEKTGTLTLSNTANVTTANGGITLNNSDAKAGKIVFNDGAKVSSLAAKAGQGTVIVAIGSASPAKVAGPTPGNSTVTGTVFFGKNGINSIGTTPNVFTGKNTNLIFSTGTQPATAIQVGSVNGGVSIIADPPAPTAAAAIVAPVTSLQPTQSSSMQNTLQLTSSPVFGSVTLPQPLVATSQIATTLSAPAMILASSPIGLSATPLYGRVSQDAEGIVDCDSHFGGNSGAIEAALSSEMELGLSPGTATGADFDKSINGHSSEINLRTGNLVLAPTVQTVVKTPCGQIDIAPNAMVLVMSLPQGLAVYDLHDTRQDAVIVSSGSTKLSLKPGKHVLLAPPSVHSFEEVNPAEFIGYGEVRNHTLENGTQLFTGEFSIPSAIASVRPLAYLVSSKHANARHLSGSMLKTAAIIMQLRGGTSYHQKTRGVLTAYGK